MSTWKQLMDLLGGKDFYIEKVRIVESNIAIEGDFTPPPLTCLSLNDQMFVVAFLASHGSIKRMEALFDISYPTVKNRLNRITATLDITQVERSPGKHRSFTGEILEKLERGELSFEEVMEELE